MTGGFVIVPRLEADLLGDEQEVSQTHRGAWLWLYDKAAFKEGIDRLGRFTVRLKRGEIAVSLRFLARAWNWSHGKVQRWLKLLADRGKITLRTEDGVIVIGLRGYSRIRESNPESQKSRQRAAEVAVDDQQPSQSRKEESQVDIKDSKSVPVRRFAARTPQTKAQIRDRWIAKLGRYAHARGFIGEFWTKGMGDNPAAYYETVNARMKAENWSDTVDEADLAADRERRRSYSFGRMQRRWGHYR
jgi:hypothetical protein